MGSRKRSAREREVAAFKAQLGGSCGLDEAFRRASVRQERTSERREVARRDRACESKQRYGSRTAAEAAIADCEAYGTRGLHCYRCTYCHGWHLTSHPRG